MKTKYELRQKIFKMDGVIGEIRSLFTVEDGLKSPMFIAFGKHKDSIVVDNIYTAQGVISYLKENKLGRENIIILEQIQPQQKNYPLPPDNNILGYAIDLISYDKRLENIFRQLLKDKIIVQSIDSAKKYIGKYEMTSLDDVQVNLDGIMTGGWTNNELLKYRH